MGQWSDSLLATILAQGVGGGALQLWAGHAASLLVGRYVSEPASREFHVGQAYLRQLAAQGVSKEEGSFWCRIKSSDDHLWGALSTFRASVPEDRVVVRLLELLCFKAPSASVCTRAFGVLLKIAGSPENLVRLLQDPYSPAHRLAIHAMSAERRVALALTILTEGRVPGWYLVGLELLRHPDNREAVLARREVVIDALLDVFLGPKRVGQSEVSACMLALFPDDERVARVALSEDCSFDAGEGPMPESQDEAMHSRFSVIRVATGT